MRPSLPVCIAFLAALGLLGSVSGRALSQGLVESTCSIDECRAFAHRSLLVPVKPRADIFLGDDPPPHESDPTSGDPSGGNAAGGSGRGDPGSDGDPGLLTAGGDTGPSTAGDRSASLSYDQYQNRGSLAVNNLRQAIQSHNPDATNPDLLLGYKPWEDPAQVTCEDLGAIFSDTDISLNSGTQYEQREWESLVLPAGRQPADSTMVSWSLNNPGENTIVIKEMNSKADGLPTGDARKLSLSEIIWQTWAETAGNGKGNLRIIIHDPVDNKGTLDTIDAAYAKNGLDATRAKGDFASDGQNANRNDAFEALLGTDNVRPIVYMLTDHHQELADKEVQRIFTYPPGYKGGATSGWTVAIIIW